MANSDNRKPEKSGGIRVSRRDSDMVFAATATEKLRHHRSSDLQPPAQKERIKKKAEEIVLKANQKKEKNGS